MKRGRGTLMFWCTPTAKQTWCNGATTCDGSTQEKSASYHEKLTHAHVDDNMNTVPPGVHSGCSVADNIALLTPNNMTKTLAFSRNTKKYPTVSSSCRVSFLRLIRDASFCFSPKGLRPLRGHKLKQN
ncbi:unnamed protein product [Ectocarpus sp. 12 AP-2014]